MGSRINWNSLQLTLLTARVTKLRKKTYIKGMLQMLGNQESDYLFANITATS